MGFHIMQLPDRSAGGAHTVFCVLSCDTHALQTSSNTCNLLKIELKFKVGKLDQEPQA